MTSDTKRLQELAQKCIDIHDELSSVHRELKVMCGNAERNKKNKQARRCADAGEFLVQAGSRLMKAQGVICDAALKSQTETNGFWDRLRDGLDFG